MFHIEKESIKKKILKGNFGLEKESLRMTKEGFLSHQKDPFYNEKNIVKDFAECQCEINTGVNPSAKEALTELYTHTKRIQRTIASLEEPELLWPFSNPPYIRSENDIQIAIFTGTDEKKSEYRAYLSDRYGRYKMALSGIHVNYSFDDALLEEDFKWSSYEDFSTYKNNLYLHVAKGVALYGWIINVLCAASPILDSSYQEKGVLGVSLFNGMASTRCSELGYWNTFSPIFNYSSLSEYTKSIQLYVNKGLIVSASELYYPVRLKSRGINTLERLEKLGVDHIELRNVDLNPLYKEGLNLKDLQFIQLFLVWLACIPIESFTSADQVAAIQNYKNAAHYDLKTVKINIPHEETCSVVKASFQVLEKMKDFYAGWDSEIDEILQFEQEKIENPEKRYAWIVRKEYEEDFVKKGIELAKKYQKEAM